MLRFSSPPGGGFKLLFGKRESERAEVDLSHGGAETWTQGSVIPKLSPFSPSISSPLGKEARPPSW